MSAYAGEEILIIIGVLMAVFPIFYAVIENDLRRVLAYSLINQVGFMVIGIGVGTELAINGATAHVVSDVLFKGLLFMSLGAVMYRTGTVKATQLGGLYKSMPFTCVCCMVGAASISAFPLFCGFVSKSMIMTAVAQDGHIIVWLLLLFASAGVFHHAGIKIPFFTFFAHDAGHRVKEAPVNMRWAMGIAAVLCIFVGTAPDLWLYQLLPYQGAEPVYVPYTVAHVVTQTQLLFFSALAFAMLLLSGIYPAEIRSVNIDADFIYRRFARITYNTCDAILNDINRFANTRIVIEGVPALTRCLLNLPASMIAFCVRIGAGFRAPGDYAVSIREENASRSVKTGTLPIGVAGLLPLIFIIVLLLLW